ncbi:MAG: lamin tail domain-containing protein [Pirellulales bacterium]
MRLESLEHRLVLTDVSGAIAANTTWTRANSPYNVVGDVTVQAAATLKIEPGVVMNFSASTGITVSGRLVAEGTAFDRITFQRAAGAGSDWDGLSFADTLTDSRITFADFIEGDGQGESIHVVRSRLYLEGITWTGTTGPALEMEHPSVILRNSMLPTTGGSEVLHGEYIEGDEYLIIDGNVFPDSNNGGGANDVVDILGADRPGPVMQILNNVFLGGGDDGLDLDGTDAHIEGNVFMNFHRTTSRATTSNAIATGLPQTGETNRTQITVVHNIFVNNDHHMLLKEDAFATVENNVFVGATLAAIQFNEIGGTAVNGPGMGAALDGNIFYNNALLFKNLTKTASFETQLTVDNSLLPDTLQTYSDGSTALAHSFGTGNIDANPMFVDAANNNYRLLSGSPAIGAATNGIDMGAYVPAGPTIGGVPTGPSTSNDQTFTVAGPGITDYRYRVDGGPYSAVTPVSQPIVLADLDNGEHIVEVLGMNDAGEWFQGQTPAFGQKHAEVIVPSRTRTGEALPMIVRVRDAMGNINTLLTTPASFTNGSQLAATDFKVKKGVGSLAPTVTASADFALAFGGSLATGSTGKAIDVLDGTFPVQTHSGTLAGNTVWDNTTEHRITGNLTIPAGSTLTIQPGTRVMLGGAVNILVDGAIATNGTAADPVAFNAINPAQDWGGIEIRGAAASGDFAYTFFTQGGADTSRTYGHSNSQPLLRANSGTIDCSNCFVINNTGKGFGAQSNARINFDQGVISHSDTGGQVDNTVMQITNSWIKDLPNDSPGFLDDDSDGQYFHGVHSSGEPSLVQNSYIIDTKDDCLDHNGARLNVISSWLEGCTHEGLASSDSNWANVVDTVVTGTNQGFEAGYGGPQLSVTNSVSVRVDNKYPNDTSSDATINAGIRFGDGYNGSNGAYTGHITAINNVVADNEDNIRNFDGTGPQAGAIDITYSMTNDADYNAATGNFSGIPVFGPYMHLLRGSAGLNAGSDGETVGRLFPAVSATFTIESPDALLRIDEAQAINNGGASSDMIELVNAGGAASVDLSGMSITNDPSQPALYVFGPGTILGPGERMILFADMALGSPAETHVGFTLDEAGDEVLLYDSAANGGALIDSVTFGRQLDGTSIARVGGTFRLAQPTIGSANVALPTALPGGVKLNEWLAAPGGAVATDFIELYNPSLLPVDIGGLHLTNDPAGAPGLFAIRPLSFVAGEGFAVFLADNNVAAGFDHVNFELDAAGGSIALNAAVATTTIDSIVYGLQTAGISDGRTPNGGDLIAAIDPPTPGADNPEPDLPDVFELVTLTDTWRYDQSGANLGTTWKETAYNDAAWPQGPSVLGVESSALPAPAVLATTLDLNADGVAPNTTTFYFRTHFNFAGDPAAVLLRLGGLIDDGAVYWLNGHEIHRFNMDPGPVNFDTTAASTEEASAFLAPTLLSAQYLQAGDNVLAVEVHQVGTTSSDIVLGVIFDAIEIVDVTPPSAPTNLSGTAATTSRVDLTWNAASDAETGVAHYRIYRNNTPIGTSATTSFSDTTVLVGQTYQYEVSAVNLANLEGARSQSTSVSVTNQVTIAFQDGVLPTPAYTGTADTWLQQTAPTSTHGADGTIETDAEATGGNANSQTWGLFRWDVSSIPAGATVESANLMFEVNNASNNAYDLYASLRPWSETQANWNEYAAGQPWGAAGGTGPTDRGTTVVGSLVTGTTGQKTVTLNAAGVALVESWIANPANNHGLMLYNPSNTDGVQIRSADYGTLASRPKLTISYSAGDSIAPLVTSSSVDLSVAPQRLQFVFSEEVLIAATNLTLTNSTTSETVPSGSIAMSYNTSTNTATFTFPGFAGGVLPSGDYTASLSTVGVTDLAGNPLQANGNETLAFTWLRGDVDESGAIDAADIDALYAAFSPSNGNPRFDLNGSGSVNQLDVDVLVTTILGTQYGDANLDGDVDRADAATLAAHFGGPGGWADGNFDGSATGVALADLAMLQGNLGFGIGGSPAAPAAVVASPSLARPIAAARGQTRALRAAARERLAHTAVDVVLD